MNDQTSGPVGEVRITGVSEAGRWLRTVILTVDLPDGAKVYAAPPAPTATIDMDGVRSRTWLMAADRVAAWRAQGDWDADTLNGLEAEFREFVTEKPAPAVPDAYTLTREQAEGCAWALAALPQHDHVAKLRSAIDAMLAASPEVPRG